MSVFLKRKIDNYLAEWKLNPEKQPLIIKGARQIGKTFSIENFGKQYKSFIEINFITEPEYRTIFSNGYKTDSVIKEISLINPNFEFIPGETLIFFDELQSFPDCATSLKFFKLAQSVLVFPSFLKEISIFLFLKETSPLSDELGKLVFPKGIKFIMLFVVSLAFLKSIKLIL